VLETSADRRTQITTVNAVHLADEFLRRIPALPTSQLNGRGIVTCAGGIRYNVCAWVLIRVLRKLGCTLPIEVWYVTDEERDEDWIELVEPFGVTCRRAKIDTHHPHPRSLGWSAKSHAMINSRFEEVLFLDADNVPAVDPTFLFDEDEYRRTGAVFWPDVGRMPPDRAAWEVFGVAYRDERAFESGQMLIDKGRCWRALHLADWYNRNAGFFYNFVYGDKDTFRFAWHRAGLSYAMPSRRTAIGPGVLYQHDFDGNVLFQHRIGGKWSLRSNRRIPGFVHEDFCHAKAEELKQIWRPIERRIAKLPRSDLEMMDAFRDRRYRYFRDGRRRGRLRLLNPNYSPGARR